MVVDDELLHRLEQLAQKPFVAEVFRITFGSTPPEKANTRGARWNPPDVAAVYTSLERETVLAEAEHLMASQPVRPHVRRELHRIRVSLQRTLDLRSPLLLAELGVDERALGSSDFWACRRLGEAASHLGCDGILVPSARADGYNLVIYTTNDLDDGFDVLETELLEDPTA